jgi:hypothetical protein
MEVEINKCYDEIDYNAILQILINNKHPDTNIYKSVLQLSKLGIFETKWLYLCICCLVQCKTFRFPKYFNIETKEDVFKAWNMFTGFYNPEQVLWRTDLLYILCTLVPDLKACTCCDCAPRIILNDLKNLIEIAENNPKYFAHAVKNYGYGDDIGLLSDLFKVKFEAESLMLENKYNNLGDNKQLLCKLGIYQPIQYIINNRKRSNSVMEW